MEFLEFHRLFNELLGLPTLIEKGEATNREWRRLLYECYRKGTEIIMVLCFIGEIAAIPVVWQDMNVLCGCLASVTHSLQVLLKTLHLNLYKDRFRTYLKDISFLRDFSEALEIRSLRPNPSFARCHTQQSKHIRYLLAIHFIVIFLSTSAYFFPFMYDCLAHYDQVDRMQTPIVVNFSMGIYRTPIFQIATIFLMVCFYLYNLKTVVMDNFILGVISLATSHYRYHKQLLQDIVIKYDYKKRDELQSDERQACIREWIMAHQELQRITSHLERMLYPYLFFEFFYVLIHTCVPAFVITSTFSWTIPQKIAVGFIAGGGVIELLLMSRAGDTFSESWETVADDLFLPDVFEGAEKRMRDYFAMTRLRMRHTFRLSAFKLFPLGCSTFATISRLIVSHYMTLNQLQKIKSEKN